MLHHQLVPLPNLRRGSLVPSMATRLHCLPSIKQVPPTRPHTPVSVLPQLLEKRALRQRHRTTEDQLAAVLNSRRRRSDHIRRFQHRRELIRDYQPCWCATARVTTTRGPQLDVAAVREHDLLHSIVRDLRQPAFHPVRQRRREHRPNVPQDTFRVVREVARVDHRRVRVERCLPIHQPRQHRRKPDLPGFQQCDLVVGFDLPNEIQLVGPILEIHRFELAGAFVDGLPERSYEHFEVVAARLENQAFLSSAACYPVNRKRLNVGHQL